MTKNLLRGSVLALSFFFSGCEKPATVATAPTVDTDAVSRTIRDLEAEWAKVFAAKDAVKFAASYAPNASLYITGAPGMQGAAAIAEGLKGAMSDPNFSGTFQTSKVHVASSGDFACSEGTYDSTMTGPAKKKIAESGHYLTCWKKQADNSWKVVADMTASEPPKAKPGKAKM